MHYFSDKEKITKEVLEEFNAKGLTVLLSKEDGHFLVVSGDKKITTEKIYEITGDILWRKFDIGIYFEQCFLQLKGE